MRSIKVEISRSGSVSREGLLRPDEAYIIAVGDEPAYKVEVGLSDRDYRGLLRLLNSPKTKPVQALEALDRLGRTVTDLLRSDRFQWAELAAERENGPLQIDLVLNPAELSGLPFEVALAKDGRSLFQQEPPLVMTRRVRGRFRSERQDWPAATKVLFAWASPAEAGETVPHVKHQDILLEVLQPWIGQLQGMPQVPDYRTVLTIVGRASLASIRKACETTEFTHIHILAHGVEAGGEDDPIEQRFGLALHGDDGALQAVTPDQLADAIEPALRSCNVVTLASCYGGSQSNPYIPEGGLAHTLHVRGVPIVLGSQWPLSFPGSEILTKEFYNAILSGGDARLALQQTRVALYQSARNGGAPDVASIEPPGPMLDAATDRAAAHDWASLVGYIALPEGYTDYLVDVALRRSLAAMETASRWADDLVRCEIKDEAAYQRVYDRLNARMAVLRDTLDGSRGTEAMLREHHGLLGSVHKRLAELLHYWNRQVGESAERTARMREALQAAREWYRKGFDNHPQDHWLATQSISLEAVLEGKIADPVDWQIGLRTAGRLASKGDLWALGSLAELHLLAPLAGGTGDLGPAREALTTIRTEAPTGKERPITRRQLQRYIDWWTAANGFFPGSSDLVAGARELVAVLDADDEP